jgi:hypothetical protein
MACRGSGVRIPSDPPKPLMNAKLSGVLFSTEGSLEAFGAFLGPF